jgi:hypothetical protein
MDLGKIELEDLPRIEEYVNKIRETDSSKVVQAYSSMLIDLIREREGFDKPSLIDFINKINELNVIDNRATCILLEFIKPM